MDAPILTPTEIANAIREYGPSQASAVDGHTDTLHTSLAYYCSRRGHHIMPEPEPGAFHVAVECRCCLTGSRTLARCYRGSYADCQHAANVLTERGRAL